MFPQHTRMSLTTQEIAIFLQELGQLRQDLGACLARMTAFAERFEQITKIDDRLGELEESVEHCQDACARERSTRRSVVHWIAYAVAGIVPGAATWYLTRHLP